MTTATYSVTGMTCSHCVGTVADELRTLDGVTVVDIELNVGGASQVTVTSSAPLDDAAVREAVDEAGYALSGEAG